MTMARLTQSQPRSSRFGRRSIEDWATCEWDAIRRAIEPLDHRTYNAFFNPDYGTFRFYSQPNKNGDGHAKSFEDIARSLSLAQARSPLAVYHPPIDSIEELEDRKVRDGVESVGATLQQSGAFNLADNYPPGRGIAQVLHCTLHGWKVMPTKCPMHNHGRLLFCHSGDCQLCLPLMAASTTLTGQLPYHAQRDVENLPRAGHDMSSELARGDPGRPVSERVHRRQLKQHEEQVQFQLEMLATHQAAGLTPRPTTNGSRVAIPQDLKFIQQTSAHPARPITSPTAKGGMHQSRLPGGRLGLQRPATRTAIVAGSIPQFTVPEDELREKRSPHKKNKNKNSPRKNSPLKKRVQASPTPPITPISDDFPPLPLTGQMTSKTRTNAMNAAAPTSMHNAAPGFAARDTHGQNSELATLHHSAKTSVGTQLDGLTSRPSSTLSAKAPIFQLSQPCISPLQSIDTTSKPIFGTSFKPSKYGELSSSQARPGLLRKRPLMLPLGMRRTTPDGVALKRFLQRKAKNGQTVDRKLSGLMVMRRVSELARGEDADAGKESESKEDGCEDVARTAEKKQVAEAIPTPASCSSVPRPASTPASLPLRPPVPTPAAALPTVATPTVRLPTPAQQAPPNPRSWTREDQSLLNRLTKLQSSFLRLGGTTQLYALSNAPWSIKQCWTFHTQRLHDKLVRFEADLKGEGGVEKMEELRERYKRSGEAEFDVHFKKESLKEKQEGKQEVVVVKEGVLEQEGAGNGRGAGRVMVHQRRSTDSLENQTAKLQVEFLPQQRRQLPLERSGMAEPSLKAEREDTTAAEEANSTPACEVAQTRASRPGPRARRKLWREQFGGFKQALETRGEEMGMLDAEEGSEMVLRRCAAGNEYTKPAGKSLVPQGRRKLPLESFPVGELESNVAAEGAKTKVAVEESQVTGRERESRAPPTAREQEEEDMVTSDYPSDLFHEEREQQNIRIKLPGSTRATNVLVSNAGLSAPANVPQQRASAVALAAQSLLFLRSADTTLVSEKPSGFTSPSVQQEASAASGTLSQSIPQPPSIVDFDLTASDASPTAAPFPRKKQAAPPARKREPQNKPEALKAYPPTPSSDTPTTGRSSPAVEAGPAPAPAPAPAAKAKGKSSRTPPLTTILNTPNGPLVLPAKRKDSAAKVQSIPSQTGKTPVLLIQATRPCTAPASQTVTLSPSSSTSTSASTPIEAAKEEEGTDEDESWYTAHLLSARAVLAGTVEYSPESFDFQDGRIDPTWAREESDSEREILGYASEPESDGELFGEEEVMRGFGAERGSGRAREVYKRAGKGTLNVTPRAGSCRAK